jgi:hypothetical protein
VEDIILMLWLLMEEFFLGEEEFMENLEMDNFKIN